MNIIMASDNRGIDMMLVAIYSVIKNNLDTRLNFYVINTDISEQSKKRAKKLAERFTNAQIIFILADKKLFDGVELTNKTVSMPAYYRYLAPGLLPNEDRALYMDIDMMCLDGLGQLYATNLDEYHLGAVEDYFVSKTDDYPGFKKGIGFSTKDKYANSGLLLMNLAKMRESGIMETFWDNIRRKAEIIPAPYNIFADQTVTNLTFKGKIKFLPSKYNVLTTAMKYTRQSDAIIVHFAGPDKPFTYRDEYSAKYDDMYYDYYDECMSIVGGNGNLMIKNTIKRLGRETTDAIKKRSDIEQLALDKASHVEELSAELANVSRELEITRAYLADLKNSVSWKVTKPLRGLGRVKRKVVRRG